MDQQQKSQVLPQTTLKRQPVICPWTAAQPYPSPLTNKNRNVASGSFPLANHVPNSHWPNVPISATASKLLEKNQPLPMQHSSSQFFYFLRLMELFPETHPATLHTVLTLCRNNFFCAVDKLLYAKRCKALYSRRAPQRYAQPARTHPYSNAAARKSSCAKSEAAGGGGGANPTAAGDDATEQNGGGGVVVRTDNAFRHLANSLDQRDGVDALRHTASASEEENLSKDEEEMISPSDIQHQLKVQLKPLSPASENAEDLSSLSPPRKIKVVVQ